MKQEPAFTRRQIVKTLLALGAGGVSLSYWTHYSGDEGKVTAALSGDENDGKPSLKTFTALSSMITLRDTLDAETAKRMYGAFMDEPWGPEHIQRVYQKISDALKGDIDPRKRPSLKDGTWDFDDGEKWFVGHMLTTWYLGVYYHEERPTRRLAYETALMFDSVRGLMPIPLVESTGYGLWADAPEDVK